MFYNHELLTSRRHGVATIWLVATLGSRSNLKTVSRKAIAEIDVSKACETITNPEAPLALRLQASLLYGVSRVHSQQCGYMLHDMYSFKDRIKDSAIRADTSLEIDHNTSKMRPEHLNLPEDSLFIPELDINFDLTIFDNLAAPQNPSLMTTTPKGQHEKQAQHGISINVGHNVVGTADNGLHDDVDYYAQPSLIRPLGSGVKTGPGNTGAGSRAIEEESPIIDDPGFTIADDGSLVPLPLPPPETVPIDDDPFRLDLSLSAAAWTGGGGGSGGFRDSAGVIRTMDPGNVDQARVQHSFDDLDDHMLFEDFEPRLPSARPFSLLLPRDPTPDDQGQGQQATDASFIQPGSTSTTTATAVAANAPQQRTRKTKVLQVDTQAEVTNSELRQWADNYLTHMASLISHKEHRGSVAQAKKVAAFWIIDQGIGGVEVLFGQDRTKHPLAVFSGQSLLDALTGRKDPSLSPPPPPPPGGSKRSRSRILDDDDDEEGDKGQQSRRVRSKQGYASQDILAAEDDLLSDMRIESEVGRHGQSSLPDRPSVQSVPSALMPWSRGSGGSRHSSAVVRRLFGFGGNSGHPHPQQAASGNAAAAAAAMLSQTLARRRSRLTSASPLLGKGPGRGHGHLTRLPSLSLGGTGQDTNLDRGLDRDLDRDLGLGSDVDNFNPDDLGLQFLHSEGDDDDNFDLQGANKQPGAQTAGSSHAEHSAWKSPGTSSTSAIENEMFNFLDFIHARIEEGEQGEQDEQGERTTITLDQLLPPEENTCVVGAQALLHVLSLATRGLIEVHQKEPWKEIRLIMLTMHA